MTHDDLISALARDVRPVPRHAAGRRIALALVLGGAVTLALVVFGLGVRPDLALAVRGSMFWMKGGYTAAFAACGLILLLQLARPDAERIRWTALVLAPIAVMAVLSGVEMARMPASGWHALWMGPMWLYCPLLVLSLSAPIFAGLVWAFRRLAPSRLPAAGAAAGLLAGAVAATLYCLFCQQVSPVYIITRYTLGMALATGLGALLGPRLLRW
jgi:hypothetical protein